MEAFFEIRRPVAAQEASFSERQLLQMEATLYARRGKVWNDVHEWIWADGRRTRVCGMPEDFEGQCG